MPVALVRAPNITVNGTALSEANYEKVVDLRVEHALSVPGTLSLRFSDPTFELVDATTFDVGVEIVVKFPNDLGTLIEVFKGEIVSVGVEQDLEIGEGVELAITAYDKSHRLGHKTTVRSFLDQKYDDVVSAIAAAHGLTASITTATSVQHKYLLQTTNDYDTLNEIARILGFEWYVEGTTLKFGARPSSEPSPVAVVYGETLRRLKVRFTGAERVGTTTVRAWDPTTKRAIVGQDTSVDSPTSVLGTSSTIASNGRTKAASYKGARTSSTVPVASQAEATLLAKGIGARAAASEVYLRGEALGNPAIKVGGMVEVQQAGTRVSGKYYVTSVEHCFGRSGDYVTRFTSGGLGSNGLVDLLGASGQQVPAFGSSGLAVGIVTNNNDPDGMGRVKVKLPALSETVETWWARVVTAGAGTDTGVFAMPQIDDEVLVGFEHGDLRRPYVLGGLYGGSVKPPATTSQFVANQKIIQWNMKTGGHDMVFRSGDQPAEQHVKVVTKDTKATLYLGADKVELISSDKTVEIKNGSASILLAANGDVTIKGNKITLQAQADVAVNGLNVNTKAQATAKVEGGASVEIKGSASAKVESSGMTEIKGSMVKVN